MTKTTKKIYQMIHILVAVDRNLKNVVVTLLSDFKIQCLCLETTIILMGSNVRQKGVKNGAIIETITVYGLFEKKQNSYILDLREALRK